MKNELRTTVIIRTLAEEHRFAGLQRAIDSILRDDPTLEKCSICVVVNGSKADENVLRWLGNQNLNVIRIAEASLRLAFLKGINAVCTPYFGFLDDDDEYLSGALAARVSALELHPDWDVVVTNGYKCFNGIDTLALTRLNRVAENPLLELFRENWIGSCTSLFRTESFSTQLYEEIPNYLEWSYLGFKFAFAGKHIGVINEPTFRINDTPGSASKSQPYQDTHIDFYSYVLSHNLPPTVANEVQIRLQDAWALKAMYAMHAGQLDIARKSLREMFSFPAWWRYYPLAIRIAFRSIFSTQKNKSA